MHRSTEANGMGHGGWIGFAHGAGTLSDFGVYAGEHAPVSAPTSEKGLCQPGRLLLSQTRRSEDCSFLNIFGADVLTSAPHHEDPVGANQK
jgi:hypothetical protein